MRSAAVLFFVGTFASQLSGCQEQTEMAILDTRTFVVQTGKECDVASQTVAGHCTADKPMLEGKTYLQNVTFLSTAPEGAVCAVIQPGSTAGQLSSRLAIPNGHFLPSPEYLSFSCE